MIGGLIERMRTIDKVGLAIDLMLWCYVAIIFVLEVAK
jgi:hypothetical protein